MVKERIFVRMSVIVHDRWCVRVGLTNREECQYNSVVTPPSLGERSSLPPVMKSTTFLHPLKEGAEGDSLLPVPHTTSRKHAVRDRPTLRDKLAMLAIASLICLIYYASPHLITPTPYIRTRNPAYLIKAQHGAVASENERCSKVGVQVLKDGGNAVDAAVATTFCVGVVNLFSYVVNLIAFPMPKDIVI